MAIKKGEVQKNRMNSMHQFLRAKVRIYFPLNNATTIQIHYFFIFFQLLSVIRL